MLSNAIELNAIFRIWLKKVHLIAFNRVAPLISSVSSSLLKFSFIFCATIRLCLQRQSENFTFSMLIATSQPFFFTAELVHFRIKPRWLKFRFNFNFRYVGIGQHFKVIFKVMPCRVSIAVFQQRIPVGVTEIQSARLVGFLRLALYLMSNLIEYNDQEVFHEIVKNSLKYMLK